MISSLAGCGDDGPATETGSTTGTDTSTTDAATTTTGVPTTSTDPTTTTDPTTSTDPTTTTDPTTSTDPTTTTDPTTGTGDTTDTTTGTTDTTTGSSSESSSSSGGAVCGDGVIDGDEACDDGVDNADDAACTLACVAAICGDTLVQTGVEDCDDGAESATCNADCSASACGDGIINMTAKEQCDEGGESDVCDTDCTLSACGDGVVNATAGETCDDGNVVSNDGCSSVCESEQVDLGNIFLGGSNYGEVQATLDLLGVTYTEQPQMFIPPNTGDVIILANDGGVDAAPDYTPHMTAGNHLLVIGGSGTNEFAGFIGTYFTVGNFSGWHQADDCQSDWNKEGPAHLLTAMLPATYDFANPSLSYHMIHLTEAGQPAMVTLLGRTCHQAPDNHLLAVRKYPGGGTFTFMAFDFGAYTDPNSQTQFVAPFLTGYFDWLEAGAP